MVYICARIKRSVAIAYLTEIGEGEGAAGSGQLVSQWGDWYGREIPYSMIYGMKVQ